MMNNHTTFCFFVLYIAHTNNVAQGQCDCNPVGTFPATINGIEVTETTTGDVSTYFSIFEHCGIKAGPRWLGQVGPFSQTITFSEPVNNIKYVINASNYGEDFNFSVNKGALSTTQTCGSCPYTQSGNRFITQNLAFGNNYYGSIEGNGAGVITLTSTVPYTSITISGKGGGNGSLIGICAGSIAIEGASSNLACNAITSTSFVSIASLQKTAATLVNLTGKWIGGNAKGTKSELELVQEGNKIKGYESIRFIDGSEALYSLSGSVYGDQVEWTEDDPFPFEANLLSNIILCKTYNVFSVNKKNENFYLVGNHTSVDKKKDCNGLHGDYCYAKATNIANIITSKPANHSRERKVVPVMTVALPEKEFTIIIWDDHKEDGDIVTLYLNGEPVLENYTLKNAPTEIHLVCTAKENELIMYAENMGSSPPNTAALKVKCKNKMVKQLVLKSTNKKSESIVFKTE
jgi:hypothetical protein